jgi:hypothetical protein
MGPRTGLAAPCYDDYGGILMQTQNVKLSLPRDLVRKARHVAVERGVSLSALVGSCLEEVVAPEQSYEQARDRAIARMRQGLAMGLGERPAWTRDELHER